MVFIEEGGYERGGWGEGLDFCLEEERYCRVDGWVVGMGFYVGVFLRLFYMVLFCGFSLDVSICLVLVLEGIVLFCVYFRFWF